jgi:hypothetical protein
MQIKGPLIPCEWRHPDRPSTPGVRGVLIVDTAANRTSIALDAAQELALMAVGTMPLIGAGGATEAPTYEALLAIQFARADGQPETVGRRLVCGAMPQFARALDGNYAPGDSVVRVVGVLGREFLRFCRLTFDGVHGSFELVVDEPDACTG